MTHLYTTRDGIYIGETKVLDGKFFGIATNRDVWYAVGTRTTDIHTYSMDGYVISFQIDDNRLVYIKEIAKGLDNGCHQMICYDNSLYILETYLQRIAKIDLTNDIKEYIYPLPRAISSWYFINGLEGSFENYIHINAITVQDGKFYIMCPQLRNVIVDGKPGQGRHPSQIMVFDSEWNLVDTFNTGKFFCHDLVFVGHDIYFSDATNTICKMNIVTREVEDVWKVEPVSPELRRICRGLSLSQSGEAYVGTHDLSDNSFLVNIKSGHQIKVTSTPCCIRIINEPDFNDENSTIRKSYVILTKPDVMKGLQKELKDLHSGYKRVGTAMNNITSFLSPNCINDREDFFIGHPHEKLDVRFEDCTLPSYLTESGPFYLYPQGHGMGWHTNNDNMVCDEGFEYRMYIVDSTDESYFFYVHPESKKVHAVRDCNDWAIVFKLGDFWHAVACLKGSRLSYGVKFNKDAFNKMFIKPIWENNQSESYINFNYTIHNKNLTDYYKYLDGIDTNQLRVRLEDVPLISGVIGRGQFIPSIRSSKVYWIPKTEKWLDIYTKLFNMIGRCNDTFYNFRLTDLSEMQYTIYDVSFMGKYDWHIDIGPQNSNRKLTVVVQLSDPSEYEGGELQIRCGGSEPVIVEKTKGSVIIFPSYLLHRVTTVTKGVRRVLILWAMGPPFC
jgi:PKHD-type hydroxylase